MKSNLDDAYVEYQCRWTKHPRQTAESIRRAIGIPAKPLISYEGLLLNEHQIKNVKKLMKQHD